MKKKHGNIYLLPFNEDFIVLFRPVFAAEYEEIMSSVARVAGVGCSTTDAERELARQLVYRCALYPKITPSGLRGMIAGVAPTLANAIHWVSGFFSTADLQNMVYEV